MPVCGRSPEPVAEAGAWRQHARPRLCREAMPAKKMQSVRMAIRGLAGFRFCHVFFRKRRGRCRKNSFFLVGWLAAGHRFCVQSGFWGSWSFLIFVSFFLYLFSCFQACAEPALTSFLFPVRHRAQVFPCSSSWLTVFWMLSCNTLIFIFVRGNAGSIPAFFYA